MLSRYCFTGGSSVLSLAGFSRQCYDAPASRPGRTFHLRLGHRLGERVHMREEIRSTGFASARRFGLFAAVVAVCFAWAGAALAETRFTIVDSSPSSWVARGYDNYTITPADGWS